MATPSAPPSGSPSHNALAGWEWWVTLVASIGVWIACIATGDPVLVLHLPPGLEVLFACLSLAIQAYAWATYGTKSRRARAWTFYAGPASLLTLVYEVLVRFFPNSQPTLYRFAHLLFALLSFLIAIIGGVGLSAEAAQERITNRSETAELFRSLWRGFIGVQVAIGVGARWAGAEILVAFLPEILHPLVQRLSATTPYTALPTSEDGATTGASEDDVELREVVTDATTSGSPGAEGEDQLLISPEEKQETFAPADLDPMIRL